MKKQKVKIQDLPEEKLDTKIIRYEHGGPTKTFGFLKFKLNCWREIPIDVANTLLAKKHEWFVESKEKPEVFLPLSEYDREMNLIRSSC